MLSLLMLGLVGAAFGSANIPDIVRDAPVIFKEIQPYGQDTNGDGIATTEEGQYDVDGDGRFGEAERESLGMEYSIHWAYTDEIPGLDDSSFFTLPAGRVCAAACLSQPGGLKCTTGQPASSNCLDTSPVCQTVSCKHPCVCPPAP